MLRLPGLRRRRGDRAPSPQPPRPDPLPAASLAFYDHLLRQDPEGRWWFEALPTPGRREALEHRLAFLIERLRAPARPRAWSLEELAPRPPGYAGHHAAVAACLERIAAGEIYQANLCLRFEGRLRGAAIGAPRRQALHSGLLVGVAQ